MTTNKNISYISSNLVSLRRPNNENVTVTNTFLSPSGDTFTLEYRTLSPAEIITTQSFNDLQPEISTTYPRKIVTPTDSDGSTILISPRRLDAMPTASQNYYVPLHFERFKQDVVTLMDRRFVELTAPPRSNSQLPPGE